MGSRQCASVWRRLLFELWCFFQAEGGIRDGTVTGVQTCALPILTTVADENVIEAATRTAPNRSREPTMITHRVKRIFVLCFGCISATSKFVCSLDLRFSGNGMCRIDLLPGGMTSCKIFFTIREHYYTTDVFRLSIFNGVCKCIRHKQRSEWG